MDSWPVIPSTAGSPCGPSAWQMKERFLGLFLGKECREVRPN